jgi:hypothetical protein
MACWTILKTKTCLGIVSACRVDPVVSLHIRNTADPHLPTFGPHGTKLGHSWLLWIIKSDFFACLTIQKKETCPCSWSACGVDPVVALHLRNAADKRLPTFGSHNTKLGYSWFQWKMKSGFPADLTILNKEMCLGILNACGVDPVVALHLRNVADYHLPTFRPRGTKLGHSWFQWKTKSDLEG